MLGQTLYCKRIVLVIMFIRFMVHHYYPEVTFDDLRNSDPALSLGTGINIEENQSLYWHPTVHNVADDGTQTLREPEMVTVYYNWIPGSTTAFPPGFRMITPGEEVFDTEGKMAGESEMELSISFQSCWDGINLDSTDQSHVAFPEVCRLLIIKAKTFISCALNRFFL